MLDVLVIEPTSFLRTSLEGRFHDFDRQMPQMLSVQYPATHADALALIQGGYLPTDLVIDTDLVPFSSYSDMIVAIKKVRTFGLGERDSLQFHRHAKDCKLPYEFVMKRPDKLKALPYMIALNKQSC
jgi:hypothetical protein